MEKFRAKAIALQSFHKETLNQFTSKELLDLFEKADFLEYIGTKNHSNTFSYLTENGLGISLSVSHVAGDHAEFEIRYADFGDGLMSLD